MKLNFISRNLWGLVLLFSFLGCGAGCKNPLQKVAPADAKTYNYEHFRLNQHKERVFIQPGEIFPDITVFDLDGKPFQLSTLWKDRTLVLETGSITCPIFVGKISKMDALMKKYKEKANFAILAVREAHPGEKFSHQTSFQQKLTQARSIQDLEKTQRQILVDSLDGVLHQKIGTHPNTAYVIAKGGKTLVRFEWVDEDLLDQILDRIGTMEFEANIAGFYQEKAIQQKELNARVLKRAGERAVKDFNEAFPWNWAQIK